MATSEKELKKEETCTTSAQSCSTEKAQAEQQCNEKEEAKAQEMKKEQGGCCGG